VTIAGRMIATTFWGQAWCDNLERYRDYENRIERGRTYVRNGCVVDLQIAPREVRATVSGSTLYKVKINIGDVPRRQWASICADCAGGINSLVELLQGHFAQGLMERLCRQADGLFPKPAEIRFSCSCPDHASMCKHVAAVLYGIGARLDTQPELLFRLRAVDEKELTARIDASIPLATAAGVAGKMLDAADLSALFGLDIDSGGTPSEAAPGIARAAPDAKAAARPGPSDHKRVVVKNQNTRPQQAAAVTKDRRVSAATGVAAKSERGAGKTVRALKGATSRAKPRPLAEAAGKIRAPGIAGRQRQPVR
jgi:uncharacterized Zn finger protein